MCLEVKGGLPNPLVSYYKLAIFLGVLVIWDLEGVATSEMHPYMETSILKALGSFQSHFIWSSKDRKKYIDEDCKQFFDQKPAILRSSGLKDWRPFSER